MKTRNVFYILMCLLSFSLAACQEDANDWGVDPSHDRLFRTTSFEASKVASTSILLSYNGVTSATQYVFEFSEDSLLFNSIVRTDVILADTLTPYTKGTSAVATEYRTLFENLNGTTRYSVRVKAVDERTGMESGYVNLTFMTPDEQIFTKVVPGVTNVTLNWMEGAAATHLNYGELTSSDTIWTTRRQLTAEEQQSCKMVIDDLKPGTNYIAFIYNENARRGSYKFKTLGSSSSEIVTMQPGDDINQLLADCAATGNGDVSLVFSGGNTYDLGKVTVPEGVQNLYLSGNVVGGVLPELKMSQLILSAPMKNIYFQYVDVDNELKSNFQVEINSANCFENISFDGCTIRNIPRSLIRVNTGDAAIKGISISNCIINNVGSGGYGLLNIGKAASLESISITNSTMIDMGDQLMDIRLVVDNIIISKSIFCNYTIGMGKLLRLDKQPKSISVTSMIFTGDNAGAKINSGNSDYSKYLSFAGCYLTSDFQQNDKPFTDAKVLSMTSEELFENPRAGDFHIKEGVIFEGDGKVGDPRWWKE